MSIDFFVVPTVRNKVLFVLVILAHHRRRVFHFNVTEHPTVQWTGHQGIEEVPTAPRSPWQNAFVERVIGSIRRDCLDHVVVLSDRHLKRILTRYFNYYHRWRTHLSLGMDCPESRSVQPTDLGKVVQFPELGGLHHHYERLAA